MLAIGVQQNKSSSGSLADSADKFDDLFLKNSIYLVFVFISIMKTCNVIRSSAR